MPTCRHTIAQADRAAHRGFTLVELIITVALVAILAALALPSYREFSTRMTVTDNTNNLIGALNMARAEAVKRGRAAALIANDGDWSNGWQVVVAKETAPGVVEQVPVSPGDTAQDCAGYRDDKTTNLPLCVQHRDALPERYSILGEATGSSDDDIVVFAPSGALRGATQFDFSVCRPSDQANPEQSRRVRVGASGTIQGGRDTTNAPAGSCK